MGELEDEPLDDEPLDDDVDLLESAVAAATSKAQVSERRRIVNPE